MRHAPCQLRAWLIFDVGQKSMRLHPLVLAFLAFVAHCHADTYRLPMIAEPYSVRVLLLKPSVRELSRKIVPPVPISQPLPEFPVELREAKVEGEVVVSFTVQPDGKLAGVRIVKQSQSEFRETVLEVVRRWRFSPARSGDTAVAMTLEFGVRFEFPRE